MNTSRTPGTPEVELPKLLSKDQVAEVLGVQVWCVDRLAKRGEFTRIRIGVGRGCVRFDPAEVRAYIERCKGVSWSQERGAGGRYSKRAAGNVPVTG